MTSFLDWLRTPRPSDTSNRGETETVRRIVTELEKLDPARARYLAAFAYVLSRVAAADLDISDVERNKMVELVQQIGHLPEAQAILVVQIAKSQQVLFGGTENFLVTREFREIASDDQRRDILQCLFAVAVVDTVISAEEDSQLWQIAGELGFTRQEFVQVRLAYSDKRAVLRRPGDQIA